MNMQVPIAMLGSTGTLPFEGPPAATLRTEGRHWPESNCYVDLWIELLQYWNCEPAAALPFAAAMDYEGDGFTFFKFPAEDLEVLFGVRVQEMSLHDTLEWHVARQVEKGRAVLMEADAFHLPDTLGTTYGREHGKTTIGVLRIDPMRREAAYIHNRARAKLEGADYDLVLAGMPERMPPYVESARRIASALTGSALRDASRMLLGRHMRRRPGRNPVAGWREVFPQQLETLLQRDGIFFHRYAFDNLRQLGANFELLGSYAAWLDARGLAEAVRSCDEIAAGAKTLQYRLARLVHRRRADHCTDAFDTMEAAYERLMAALAQNS